MNNQAFQQSYDSLTQHEGNGLVAEGEYNQILYRYNLHFESYIVKAIFYDMQFYLCKINMGCATS